MQYPSRETFYRRRG